MNNTIGEVFRFTIWGESHAPEIGVDIEGIPEGTLIDLDLLQTFLDRRRPGQGSLVSGRKETDRPVFVKGVKGSMSVETEEERHAAIVCGPVVSAVIYNRDARSSDYEDLRYVPRPGHADFAAMARFGEERSYAGGGPFSGRMTAPLCIAGGIALQLLKKKGIRVSACPIMIGGETDPEKMTAAIEGAKQEGDSVGGIVECVVEGLSAGVGEPMFDGVENRIAQTVFGIPAVKGVEFGAGFAAAGMKGSENNDAFLSAAEGEGDVLSRIRTVSNHHGGSLGGLSSGMPVVFRAAFKPTPSIEKEQDSVDIRTGEAVKLKIKGRHDPCIVLRAVPCVEAAAAAAVYDLLRIRENESGCRKEEKTLEGLRERIDEADRKLLRAFEERMDASAAIAAYKKEHGLPVLDREREAKKLSWAAKQVPEDLHPGTRKLYGLLFELSREYQESRMKHEDA